MDIRVAGRKYFLQAMAVVEVVGKERHKKGDEKKGWSETFRNGSEMK
jgi:hypothetical protein